MWSAEMLLKSGAAIDATSADGESPLLVAAASMLAVSAMDYRLIPSPSGHEALATMLVERGADPRRADGLGQTASISRSKRGRWGRASRFVSSAT
jgi:hypothetical protein